MFLVLFFVPFYMVYMASLTIGWFIGQKLVLAEVMTKKVLALHFRPKERFMRDEARRVSVISPVRYQVK